MEYGNVSNSWVKLTVLDLIEALISMAYNSGSQFVIANYFWWYFHYVGHAKWEGKGQTLRNACLEHLLGNDQGGGRMRCKVGVEEFDTSSSWVPPWSSLEHKLNLPN